MYVFVADGRIIQTPAENWDDMECVCVLFRSFSEYKLELFNSFNVNITLGRHVCLDVCAYIHNVHVVDMIKTPPSWRKQIALDVL